MKRLLLISPDPEAAEMLALRFELEDFDVEQADNVEAAQKAFSKTTPDLCIVDLYSLKPDAIEETQRFLKSTARKGVQTFLLLPFVPEGRAVPAFHAHHLLKKPYDLTTLVQIATAISSPRRSSSSRRGRRRPS